MKLKLILINILKINRKITDWGNVFVIICQGYIKNHKSTIERKPNTWTKNLSGHVAKEDVKQ